VVIHDIRGSTGLLRRSAEGTEVCFTSKENTVEEELMQRINRLVPIVLATVFSTAVIACETAPNPKDDVTKALDEANIEDVNVDWDADSKLLHLKGAVDTSSELAQAESVAVRAVGTSGQVVNELTVAGEPAKVADDFDGAIRERLNNLAKDEAFDGRDINFDVNNGVVTIKGQVPSEAEKARIGEMSKKTEGVKDVVNALEIAK
jgi:osmotically-inducible protein OsmY